MRITALVSSGLLLLAARSAIAQQIHAVDMYAYGISGDGNYVVGAVYVSTTHRWARWSFGGGLEDLGILGGQYSQAADANWDGSVVVGKSNDLPARWTAATGLVQLPLLPGTTSGAATAVNADGSVIVGSCGQQPVRWTQDGVQSLGMLPGWDAAHAAGVSDDGTVIIGNASAGNYSSRRLFRWTQATGLEEVATFTASGTASDLSGDGSTIVGHMSEPLTYGSQAFHWRSATGIEPLGSIPGTTTYVGNTNFDGSIFVAESVYPSSPYTFSVATIWTPTTGRVALQDYLAARGVSLSGWAQGLGGASLFAGHAVSSDGRVIMGRGYFSGQIRTFVATLPIPCYANCDQSTTQPVLNVADFGCFLQKFAAGDPYANCDQSTIAPVLNVADFGCFLQKFAAGCN